MSSQRLVNGVVDNLKNHVMQPGTVIGIADVHSGTFAYGVEASEDLNARRIVGVICG
jgi:hypothetical protein